MKPHHLMLFLLLQLVGQTIWAGELAPILTIDQAVEMALANHPALQIAKPVAALMQAQIEREHAARYPKLTARFVVPLLGTESGVTLHQQIWDFHQTQHRIQASQAQAQASAFEQTASREDVILTVKVAYYTVLMQGVIRTEAEHRARGFAKRLEQMDHFFKIGRRSKAELTQARITLDQTQLSLATARHDVESARIQLASAMGLTTPLTSELVPAITHEPQNVEFHDPLQRALAHRSELRQLGAHLAALHAQAAAARQAAYPEIFGRLAYRVKGSGADQPGFVAGIGIQGTLFDGFATTAKVKEAKAQVRQAEVEIALKQQHIATEVKQTILHLQLATERIRLTQHSQREADENFELMTEQFRRGRVSAIELSEAELLVATATSQHLQSVYQAQIAVAQLDRALGKDIDK